MEQNTTEWKNARRGKFTASEIHKLMGIKGLGETGKTYAIEKAVESVFDFETEDYVSYDMERGIELEPLAFKKFIELKEMDFLKVEQCGFFNYKNDAGASPDGLVSDDAILEIKCPRPANFFKVVAENVVPKNYFYQMQMQMLATGRSKGYFFNYCVIDGTEYWHEIVLNRCDQTQEDLIERIKLASEIKNTYANNIKLNKQF